MGIKLLKIWKLVFCTVCKLLRLGGVREAEIIAFDPLRRFDHRASKIKGLDKLGNITNAIGLLAFMDVVGFDV
jgi:hypothetical protein